LWGLTHTTLETCRVSGKTEAYCEQPRHSEYGLDRFVVVQASSSTGRLWENKPFSGRLRENRPFSGWLWERQSFSGQLQVNSRSMNTNQSYFEY